MGKRKVGEEKGRGEGESQTSPPDHLLDVEQLLAVGVRDLKAELVLDGQNHLDMVQAVEAQVLDGEEDEG